MKLTLSILSTLLLSLSAFATGPKKISYLKEFKPLLETFTSSTVYARDGLATCGLSQSSAGSVTLTRSKDGVSSRADAALFGKITERTTNLSTTYSNDDHSFVLKVDEMDNILSATVGNVECVAKDFPFNNEIYKKAFSGSSKHNIDVEGLLSNGNPCYKMNTDKNINGEFYTVIYVNGNEPYCVPSWFDLHNGMFTYDASRKVKLNAN